MSEATEYERDYREYLANQMVLANQMERCAESAQVQVAGFEVRVKSYTNMDLIGTDGELSPIDRKDLAEHLAAAHLHLRAAERIVKNWSSEAREMLLQAKASDDED